MAALPAVVNALRGRMEKGLGTSTCDRNSMGRQWADSAVDCRPGNLQTACMGYG